MDEKIVSIDLNSENSKEIIEVLGNDTCKKILNVLADKELTETEISQKLKIPLNTVDYNTKKLIKAGLIESSNHFWSIKGKRIPSYKIANKQIVISPRKFTSKVLLVPSLILGGVISLAVKFLAQKPIVQYSKEIVPNAMNSEVALMSTASGEIASRSADAASNTINATASISIAGWEWFLIGIWSGIFLFFILSYINERRSK
jgi:DNA-binding transcriptional ArsR family regulator